MLRVLSLATDRSNVGSADPDVPNVRYLCPADIREIKRRDGSGRLRAFAGCRRHEPNGREKTGQVRTYCHQCGASAVPLVTVLRGQSTAVSFLPRAMRRLEAPAVAIRNSANA